MTIQAIIKNAIKRLEREGKLLTPDFYLDAFCKEATRAGVKSEDCSHLPKLISTLNKEFQDELKNYRISNLTELSRFLISKLNRSNPSHCSNLVESYITLNKQILQSISALHNQQAFELAKKGFSLLNSEPSLIELEQYRILWNNFTDTYDDSFLEYLKEFGANVDTKDLKKTLSSLKQCEIQKELDIDTLKHLSSMLVSSLVPSIAPSLSTKIELLINKIKHQPELLESSDIEKDINDAIKSRIALDKKSVQEMMGSIDGGLDKLSNKLIEMISSSDNNTIEIKKVKAELEGYKEESFDNLAYAHKRLYNITVALEQNSEALSKNLKKHSNEVELLGKRVEQLEYELKKAQEESREDFLTKLYNKKALDEFLSKKEEEFDRYAHNYSLAIFDLDFFKKINDTYGHDAGDAVLVAFAKILKGSSRSVDIVGRFGGEEFVVLLPFIDLQGGELFAKKINQRVKNSRFMYKNQRIDVTVSVGVAQRVDVNSSIALFKKADENLYEAKNSGRDRVVAK
ncbi:MAG: GGDEF domain-containing protein [Sulfurimonadaceae bacterium]|jgi:diguanylate cyclase (GGDEF)-like protein|nr:GGDEF domain-containing protein [Sulfurimonadaceae bacterium]